MKTVKDYNLPLNLLKHKQQQQREKISTVLFYQVCADTVKAKHSRIWAQAMPFCPPNKLTFDILILKVVSESHVTWATSVPILVFLCLSVLDLGPMYTTDRQTDIRQHHRLMPPPMPRGRGHKNHIGLLVGDFYRTDAIPVRAMCILARQFNWKTVRLSQISSQNYLIIIIIIISSS